ncbi:vWA domain-containing protein [Phaeodactylibacter luteus]|uniref:VWA domain-containing protein n=1 Tax=Phaeodactylibacter luteus TaxID=1564516 RepID=A0A5C6RH16_9BACT|nr:VWA domain-containing protein [Phaeodactylibacter luteus]TXB61666.1 VWA domain-containing protein [Phaeodactylibacter luteus]
MNLLGENIIFLNPELLLLLLLLPLAGWWFYRNQRQHYPALRMPSLSGVSQVASLRARLQKALPVLRALALASLIVAMARPQEVLKEEEVEAEGIDIMLALDLSSSMLAQDFEPNRLEVSKSVAAEFVSKRPYDRIGLAVFAGEAFTQCPLTVDHRILKGFLSQIECGALQDGTAIGMGLATAVGHLEDSEAESKVVILLTDGVNNAGYINPAMAAQIAQKLGIKVYTIGVGSTGDALTPISRRSDGRYIFGMASVEIDEALLREIAEMTNGAYFRATSAESLQQIYSQIDELEKSQIDVTVIKRYSEAFHPFVLWGLLLLLAEVLLRFTLLRTIP